MARFFLTENNRSRGFYSGKPGTCSGRTSGYERHVGHKERKYKTRACERAGKCYLLLSNFRLDSLDDTASLLLVHSKATSPIDSCFHLRPASICIALSLSTFKCYLMLSYFRLDSLDDTTSLLLVHSKATSPIDSCFHLRPAPICIALSLSAFKRYLLL